MEKINGKKLLDSSCLLLKILTVHGSRHITINKKIFCGRQELLPGNVNEKCIGGPSVDYI